jgi:hypothetical protein
MMDMGEPLILTMRFDAKEAAYFNYLRRAHFPAERNFIDAHLTLFHHLPAAEERAEIERSLVAATTETALLGYRVTGLRLLGRGVAFSIASPELAALRIELASKFEAWLTPQDRAGFAPHVTVQNKTDPSSAHALFSDLAAGFAPFSGVSPGLDLWSYLGGPWRHERFFPFSRLPAA